MFDSPGAFQQALYRTIILLAAASIMIFCWIFLRISHGDLLQVVLSALSAVRVSALPCRSLQLRGIIGIVSGSAILQYIISVTSHLQLLNLLLPAAASWFILHVMSAGSAYIVLLTGFLSFTAPAGAAAGAARAVDMLLAGAAAWLAILPAGKSNPLPRVPDLGAALPKRRVSIESLMIFAGLFLYKILSMKQGIWIILTIIFICMIRQPGESNIKLVRQRIFSVPLGIMLGGIYSAAVVGLDHRLAYLVPLIAASGFFMLYYRHDFFTFSLFFMFAFTVYADWVNGTLREFNFRQLLAGRSLATVTGALLLLSIEKLSAEFSAAEHGQHEKIS